MLHTPGTDGLCTPILIKHESNVYLNIVIVNKTTVHTVFATEQERHAKG